MKQIRDKIFINKNDKHLYERGITFCNLDIVISEVMPEKTAIIFNDKIFSDAIIIKWQDDEHFSYTLMENKFKYNFDPYLEKTRNRTWNLYGT